MNQKTANIIQSLGFQISNETITKQVNDYLVNLCLYDRDYGIFDYACIFNVDKPLTNEQIKAFKKEHKVRIFVNQINTNNYKIEFFPINNGLAPKKDKVIQAFNEKLDLFVKKLEELNIKESIYCPFCGLEAEYGVFDGMNIHIHEECCHKIKDAAKAEIMKEENKSNLPLSIFLAIVGAAIGIIPMIIIMFATDYKYSILYILIPICSFYGYKIGKAPKNTAMIITVIVSSVVVVLGCDLVFYVLLALANQTTLIDVFMEFGFSEILIDLLFLAFGCFASWRLISNTTKSKISKINKM